jgi:hypothetical protein
MPFEVAGPLQKGPGKILGFDWFGRFAQTGNGTKGQGFFGLARVIERRDHDDRDGGVKRVGFQALEQFETVLPRHIDVTEDQVRQCGFAFNPHPFQLGLCFRAVVSDEEPATIDDRAKRPTQEENVVRIVVDDEDRVSDAAFLSRMLPQSSSFRLSTEYASR